MARARLITTAFNAGELSPLLDGRVDQDRYFTGCKTLSNAIPTVQGPARKRGGTRHLGLTKVQNRRAWFSDFVFSVTQAYVLEWGHLYLRFWTNRGQLLEPTLPLEVVTPYTEADLVTVEGTFALRVVQSRDVLWIVHAENKHPPRRLTRLGATSWTLTDEDFKGGPFRDINQDAAQTVYASNETGAARTITASSAIFLPGHVGSLILIESPNPGTVAPFQVSVTYVVGSIIRNSGNVYECVLDNGTSASAQRYVPVHTEGDATDGKYTWRYLHSGYGWAKITAVAGGGLSCTVDIVSRFPAQVVGSGNATRRWAFSQFSSVYGWPNEICFFRERLCYFRNNMFFASVIGDFNNFARKEAGAVTKETALALTLASDKVEQIRWARDMRGLVCGSPRAEIAIAEQTNQQVFAADNVKSEPQTEYGARLIRPLRVGEDTLFVERAGHRVRAYRFSFEVDKFKGEDLTVLSEHLFDGSELEGDEEQDEREVVDWTYQQQRDSLVWCALSDGTIACLTLNKERGVIAWTPHYIGGDGFVEAVQSIPSPDGRTDDLWLIVRRTVGGVTQRSVEYLTDYRLVKKGSGEYVGADASVTYRGAPLTVIPGLGHLNGKEVVICADGSNHPVRTVSGGQITLDRAASVVHVGYRFAMRLQPMRPEVQGRGGTSQMAKKSISDIWLRVRSSIGGRVGKSFTKMDEIKTLNTSRPFGQPPALFTGDIKMSDNGGYDNDGYVCIEHDLPLPFTAVALVLVIDVTD